MRQVLSLSFQPQFIFTIKEKAQKRGFSSISAYIKNLVLEDDDDLISPEELLEISKRADEAYKKGECIQADSIDEALAIYDRQNN